MVRLSHIASLLFFGVLLSTSCGQAASNKPFTLQTIHQSTFSRLIDDTNLVAMMFGDGRHALVSDDVWNNKKLYLIDLQSGSEQTLSLPNGPERLLSKLVYGGDQLFAVYSINGGSGSVVYQIDTNGNLDERIYRSRVSYTTDGTPAPNADDLQPLIENGQLDAMLEMRTELCSWDANAQRSSATGQGNVVHFANDQYFVETNIPDTIAQLSGQARSTHINSCELHANPNHADFAFRLERMHNPNTGYSALDNRIKRLEIARGTETLHTYEFNSTRDFFFWAVVVDQRLCLVGNQVACTVLPTD